MTEKNMPLYHRAIRSALQRRGTTMAITIVAVCLGVFGALRIKPSPSLRSLLADDEPAARALATIGEEFSALDELIIVATIPAGSTLSEADARARLQTFGTRLSNHIRQSPDLSERCISVLYEGWPQLNRFVEEALIPAALLYLDEEASTLLKERLTRQQIEKRKKTESNLKSH